MRLPAECRGARTRCFRLSSPARSSACSGALASSAHLSPLSSHASPSARPTRPLSFLSWPRHSSSPFVPHASPSSRLVTSYSATPSGLQFSSLSSPLSSLSSSFRSLSSSLRSLSVCPSRSLPVSPFRSCASPSNPAMRASLSRRSLFRNASSSSLQFYASLSFSASSPCGLSLSPRFLADSTRPGAPLSAPELLVSPSSRLLSSAVLRLDQQDASGAGKAPAMQFLSLLKAKPPEYRALLKEAANAKVVDAPLVRLASRRLSALSDQFYPPEIMELLEVFAAFPFSDEPLLAAVASRLDDLLTDPSPKRLASLLSIYARLGFCHPVVQDPLMKCIEEKMHTFDAGLLPGLCRSATSLLSPRVPILDGLATQTQLVLSAGLLCEKKSAGSPGVDAEQRRHIGALFSCLESLSRQRYSHAALIDDCLACIDLHIKAFSLQDTLRAIGAARRLGLAGVEEQLRRHMEMQAEGAMDRGDQLLAMLRLLDALRLRDSQLLQKASDAVELHSQKKAFMATQLPEALLHLSRLSPADLQLPVAILSQPALLGMAPRLSASQLQQLLSASALLLFQHIQRRKNKTGAQLGQALSARDVRALAKAVERFLALLQFQYRSLNLRERRAVKEAAALFLLELDGAEGEAASSGFAFSQTETVRFCRSVEDDDVAPTMPLVPSATVDFRSVDLVEACARLVLCDDGALHAAQAPSASKSEEGKKSRRGKSAEDQERSHPREAQTGKRALLFVAPRDTFADGLGHIPARQAELESKHGEAHEQTVTCELGGMLTDLPAAITPQAASSLLLTQLALQRQGLVRQDIRNCIPPPLKVD